MADCTHGMAKPSMCVECMEDGIFDGPEPWQRGSNPFRIKYTNTCGTCSELMNAGVDLCVFWERGEGTKKEQVLTHEDCRPPGPVV